MARVEPALPEPLAVGSGGGDKRPADSVTLRRSVVHAVGDSAFASLATFLVGLYAARYLTLPELGGYGVLFVAAFMLGSATTTQLYFTPAEVAHLELPRSGQLAAVRRSAATGLLMSVTISVVAVAIGVVVIPGLVWSDRLALAVGAAGVAAFSPTQDHIRRMLHQAGYSPFAMIVSVAQLVLAAVALWAMSEAGVRRVAIPFTALALANAGSSIVGLALAGTKSNVQRIGMPSTRSLLGLGGWLVLSSQAEQVGGFAAVAVLGALAGGKAVGQYEAARQLAQPLFVLATGIQSVLRPRVMEAAQHRDRKAAQRYTRMYVAVLSASGLLFAGVAGVPWPFNPLLRLFPNVFEAKGMFFGMIIASTLAFSTMVLMFQAIAARQERRLVRISITNQVLYVGLVVAIAGSLGALVMPVASAICVVVWLLRFRPVLRDIYGQTHESDASRARLPATSRL